MDVVKTNIEKIGGTVDLSSRPGQGTTLRIKIPLTLAIIPALVVASGAGRYAIPQVNLLELVRLEHDKAATAIEMHPRRAGLPAARQPAAARVPQRGARRRDRAPTSERATNIVVLQADDRSSASSSTTIHDTEEIVVKPLGKQLKGIAVFAGATIMGDGRVALILDVLGLAQRANVVAGDPASAGVQALDTTASHDRDQQTLLVLGVGDRRAAGDPAVGRRPARGVPARRDRADRRVPGRPVPRPDHAAGRPRRVPRHAAFLRRRRAEHRRAGRRVPSTAAGPSASSSTRSSTSSRST